MSESSELGIGERLRIFRESLRMGQAEIAAAIGGATPGYKKNEQGLTLPNSKALIGLYELGLNINWLLSNDGPMRREDLQATAAALEADLNAYGECLEILELALNKANRVLAPAKKRAAVDSMYRAWKREKKIDRQLVDMILQLAA